MKANGSQRVPFVCLDLVPTLFLIYSAARARALQMQTGIVRPAEAANCFDYALRFWIQGRQQTYSSPELNFKQLDEQTQALYQNMTDSFFHGIAQAQESGQGAQWVCRYMEALERQRNTALRAAVANADAVSQVNREVANRAQAVGTLTAGVQCATAIAAAGLSCNIALAEGGIAAVQATGVKFGADLLVDFVNNWKDGSAGAKGLAMTGKEWMQDSIEERVHESTNHYAKTAMQGWKKKNMTSIEAAGKRIEDLSARLARMQKGSNNYARTLNKIGLAKKTYWTLQAGKKGIPILSAAWDVLSAVGELKENLEKLGVMPHESAAAG